MREALGRKHKVPDFPVPHLQVALPQLEERVRAVLRRAGEQDLGLLKTLCNVALVQGWKVCRAPNTKEALDYICNLASSLGTSLVVRSEQEVFQDLPVDGPLSRIGVDVTVMAQTSGLSREALRQRAAQAGMGITGVDYAIAETGSVVVLPRRGLSRLVSLVPPVHVAIVRPQEVLESLEDLFILQRLAYHQAGGDMGSYMNFITGPSRTADIEQTLVIGVHGPKEAHLVLLE